jgi:hypothetical protein
MQCIEPLLLYPVVVLHAGMLQVRHCLPSHLPSYRLAGPKRHLKGNVQDRACISLGGLGQGIRQ